MVGGEAFVVADAAPVSADPGQRPFDDPASGQHNESGYVVTAFDDLDGQVKRGAGPVQELAGVAAVGPDEPDPVTRRGCSSSGVAPSRSWTRRR